ncbi:alpha-ketoacid dehydrogenase subunit beta [Cryobacterium sp. PH29-G1]|uniref:alpha-ketoacid dehydrogenase subunit beta n=1 Tax=Cryobacterium sp. PH29-G1 TaxID=3046211 RepID=UPI0024BA442B|nr:alpha-ketoacid dehydrogenase subunit beta [Cryobacterium sp. PH29-G1]MDJ0348639.1 alpha-ketoacid dehydrogenase subunit beta [Cryobacterium sp. PH29-G1]
MSNALQNDTLESDRELASTPLVQLSMQQAINRALGEILEADDRALIFGEDVGLLGGVFRVTDGLQQRFGANRVFDTPLAESGILGTAIGLAMAGFHPIPEIQFDGFAYPAVNQIITQLARMNYRSRGTLPMPVTLRVPSFGGIRAPEHHGESLESLFAHVPGLKVVSPSNPQQAYHLLKHAASMPDPVIFMEPKARYWNKADVNLTDNRTGGAVDSASVEGSVIARPGKHATLIAWGAMVSRCLQVAELAAEDGIELEVLDLRWLKPIDEAGLAASVSRTRRAIVVHEGPHTAGLGAEVAALVSQSCFDSLRAPVERVTGFDVPYPSGDLEDEYIPNIDRILFGVQRVLEYRRG